MLPANPSLRLLLLVFALPALAARPVARPVRGGLDDRIVTHDAVGVLVQFDAVTKADAEHALDGLATQRSLAGELKVGFFKTSQATLAAVYVIRAGSLTIKRLKELAAACSRMQGAKAAWVFVHPGPSDDEFEVEGWWRFEAGQSVAEKRLAFRDNDSWVQWNRHRLSDQQLELRKWPGWPLSELAVSLALPGRDFLERPQGLLDLSTWEFPRDVGTHQVLTVIYLPDATVLEIRQQAEATKASPSKVLQDALVGADGSKELGVPPATADFAPWDEDLPTGEKSPLRELPLFLTQEVWSRLQEKADAESLSNSRVVAYAWRHEHPFLIKQKQKK